METPTAPSGISPSLPLTSEDTTLGSNIAQKAAVPSVPIHHKFMLFPWIVSVCVSGILFLIVLLILPVEPWFFWKHLAAQYITGGAYIIADSGPMQEDYFTIHISQARLRKPGWIVVLASGILGTQDGTIFEKSALLPAGTVRDATIRVPNITPTEITETTQFPLTPGTNITIGMVYDDNGDGRLDPEQEFFVKDQTGSFIFAKAILRTNKNK